MNAKRDSTKGSAKRTSSRKKRGGATYRTCPKCGNDTLRKDNHSPSGKRRWTCRETSGDRRTCYSTVNPDAPYRDSKGDARTPDANPQFKKSLGGIKRFIITSAQNATPLDGGFWGALNAYADHNSAELVVIPIRYKNPTSRFSASQENAEVWLEELSEDDRVKYLYNQRKKLNENLTLMADIKTVPTAVKPLSGFESITGASSGVFGHTKLQMVCIPTPQGRYPKIMLTTGACTVRNYTDSKAGKKGEFHHALAALVVEIVGKKFFIRHVNYDAKRESFIDLTKEYTAHKTVRQAPDPLAIVFGDTHRAIMDRVVEKATFDKDGMVDKLNPQYLIFHDLHDGISTNHHERKNPFHQIGKRVEAMHLVEKEIREDVDWLKKVCEGRQGVVIPSNHDDFLARWLREQDWRLDPENAEFYLETALHMVKTVKAGSGPYPEIPHPFTYWVERLKGDASIRCLRRDESFTLGGVELSMHGDQGPNGARGSRQNLRRIGVKTIIGHSHTPGIEEGCYQAGTSTPLRLNYNVGPSNWLQAHVVLYANGKRAILPIIDGQWCFDATEV